MTELHGSTPIVVAAMEFQTFFRETYGNEPVRCPHIRKLFEALDAWNRKTPCEFTPEQLDGLERLGWEFLPTEPNQYNWLKFDKCGGKIAQGGDAIWSADVASVVGMKRRRNEFEL